MQEQTVSSAQVLKHSGLLLKTYRQRYLVSILCPNRSDIHPISLTGTIYKKNNQSNKNAQPEATSREILDNKDIHLQSSWPFTPRC